MTSWTTTQLDELKLRSFYNMANMAMLCKGCILNATQLLIFKLRPLPVAEASYSCFYRLEGEEVEVGREQEGEATSIALLRILLLIDNP